MSKWDKLLARICLLSKDLRFDELRKVLESLGYTMNAPKAAAVTILFGKMDVSRLPFQSMNRLKEYMLKW